MNTAVHHLPRLRRPMSLVVQVGLAVWLLPAALYGQEEVVRLPAVAPQESNPPGRLVSHPDSSSEILQAPGTGEMAPPLWTPSEFVAPAEAKSESGTKSPELPPGVRNGFFQKLLFDATWLAPGGAQGFGCNDLQLQSIFAMPCPTIQSPMVITPGFAVHYLDGPKDVDLPPRLYETYVQFRWMSQVTPEWGLDLAVTPGVYSDFDQESSESFRLTAHVAAAWTWNEKTKIVLGAAYLDRPDAEVIPIGGVVWTPNDEVKFDLVFPHPRISRRLYWGDFCGVGSEAKVEDWVYLAGEFAGDAWAIRRSDGSDDQVVLSDYRAVVGVERKKPGGLSSRIEVGYVFSRRIRYSSGTPDYRPTDTVMIRGGLTY